MFKAYRTSKYPNLISKPKIFKKVHSESEFDTDSDKMVSFGQGFHTKITKNGS